MDEAQEVEVRTVENNAMDRIVVDRQISTAKAFPRSPKKFLEDAETWACMNESIADECTYAVPREGKMIEGPSARMAEILVQAWTNCRAGSRIVEIGDVMVRAEGFFMDMERNVSVTCEVARRITTKTGRRYSDDMIVMTANAAQSVAIRNAIFRGVPQAMWKGVWEKSRLVAAGDENTLGDRRVKALEWLKERGVKADDVFRVLGVTGIEDVTLGHLATLKAIIAAVKDGELTIEAAFKAPEPAGTAPATGGVAGLKGKLGSQEPGTVTVSEPVPVPPAGVPIGQPQEGPAAPQGKTKPVGAGV